jgi:hypothetical protein
VKVVSVPASLDEHSFDQLLEGWEPETGERLLIDARHLRFADPFGMLGLLALGQYAGRNGERPLLQLPEEGDVVGYMARMDFFEHADPCSRCMAAAAGVARKAAVMCCSRSQP